MMRKHKTKFRCWLSNPMIHHALVLKVSYILGGIGDPFLHKMCPPKHHTRSNPTSGSQLLISVPLYRLFAFVEGTPQCKECFHGLLYFGLFPLLYYFTLNWRNIWFVQETCYVFIVVVHLSIHFS